MQPNSTARVIVNKTLLAMGLQPIATDALYATGILDQFGNLTGGLDKYQQQAVTLLDIFQQSLSLVFNKPAFFRKFQFNTAAPDPVTGIGQSDYVLLNQFIEGFKAGSFFNITNGSGPGNRIHLVSYNSYLESYARPDFVPIGAPYVLVPMPTEGGDSLHCTVKLVPTPDQVYTIEGMSRIEVAPIAAATDQVMFPYRYEHAIIMKLKEILETGLNEGREGSAHTYAEQFVSEVFRDAIGATEETDQMDTGISLWSRRNRSESNRDYNPATDTVVQLP